MTHEQKILMAAFHALAEGYAEHAGTFWISEKEAIPYYHAYRIRTVFFALLFSGEFIAEDSEKALQRRVKEVISAKRAKK